MNKTILAIGSIIACIIILLAGLSPVVGYKTLESEDELDILFNDIRERLDNVESREKTVEIFNDAIIELDSYGLLGGLSVEQAQKIITGRYQRRSISIPIDENENRFCIVVGKTTQTLFLGSLGRIITSMFSIFFDGNSIFDAILLLLFLSISFIQNNLQPILFGGSIIFSPFATEGWVNTYGLLGNQSWNGSLIGGIQTYVGNSTAVLGFTGLKLVQTPAENEEIYYLGYANLVRIEEVE